MNDPLSKVFWQSMEDYLLGPKYSMDSEKAVALSADVCQKVFQPIIEELLKNGLLQKIPGVTVSK